MGYSSTGVKKSKRSADDIHKIWKYDLMKLFSDGRTAEHRNQFFLALVAFCITRSEPAICLYESHINHNGMKTQMVFIK